ncbi:MAG: hypothetical protein KGJ82_03650 [Nitrospirota bacterium]|nr:hypothetical protein [Nitrospirota bacterium]
MRKVPATKKPKVRFTVTADAALLALARTAVHQTNGLTLTALFNAGLRLAIARLERQRGRRFRPTQVRLPAGRPRRPA